MLLRLSLLTILLEMISAQEYDLSYSDPQPGPTTPDDRKLELIPAPSQPLSAQEYPMVLLLADVIRNRRSTAYLTKQTPYGEKLQLGKKHRQKYDCKSWKQQASIVCGGKKRMEKN